MTYITGTVTNANPGVTLYNLMATELTALGFTLTDTVVVSTRTHKIWLSAAAGNAIGKDWYLDVVYTTTGAGTLFLGVMEFFDPATDLAYRAAYSGSRSSDATYYSPFGATGLALEGTWGYVATAAAHSNSNGNLDLPSSAFGYWITLTRDRVIVLLSSNPAHMLYAGAYAPSAGHAAAAGADVYPLFAGKFNNSGPLGSLAVGITRLPKFTTASTVAWNLKATSAIVGVSTTIEPPGFPADVTVAGPRLAAAIPLSTVGGSVFPRAYLGVFRDLATMTGDATVARGDTASDGTNTWVFATGTTSGLLLFKAV